MATDKAKHSVRSQSEQKRKMKVDTSDKLGTADRTRGHTVEHAKSTTHRGGSGDHITAL
jgi:hypothetical protein